MTWIKFALWLTGIYTTYYIALMFWDYLRSDRNTSSAEKHELTFAEDFEPFKSYLEEPTNPGNESPIAFSGGVTLKNLFNLAREESVEYIKSVSF